MDATGAKYGLGEWAWRPSQPRSVQGGAPAPAQKCFQFFRRCAHPARPSRNDAQGRCADQAVEGSSRGVA
eukprot:6698555-Pyramimonas_sp.AAC.1